MVEGALGDRPARRVFLAHTTDLLPFLEAARNAVEQVLDVPVNMEHSFPVSPASPVELCRQFVRLCDVFVVIVGSRYGSSTKEAAERSFVEMELAEAIRRGKPRLVFLVDEPTQDPRQERFRDRLRNGGTVVGHVTSPADLQIQLLTALVALPRQADGVTLRNPYLGRVASIAPDPLRRREGDLAVLAEYCTAPARAPYLCVRAPAWAGKSALLSTFVLHPPPGVDIVSFFVTARFAGQDNRRAFAHALLTQLAYLLGEEAPTGVTDDSLDLLLSTKLDAAAATCAARKSRLVLVVDGLDEDRGVEDSGYSIAALLPAIPFAGMRVVVSSRHHPPLPRDVPDGHPLRDPGVDWELSTSAEAAVIRDVLHKDLGRLLTGTPLERRLLGLVTAAGGGLTVDDLASLTERKPQELDEVFRLPAWRVLERRPGRSTGDPDSYGLAHEELVVAAAERLRLRAPRRQLHRWADGYHQLGWPEDTPTYLLDGYVRMMHATADAPRILALATSRSRHDLLLRLTGADAAALAEITSALEFFHRGADLVALVRLAQHRDRLTRRNAALPAELPAVWVHVGQPTRAIELGRTVSDPVRRAQSLAAVAHALVERGDPARARMVADEAVACTRLITDPHEQALQRYKLIGTLAVVGGQAAALALADECERVGFNLSQLPEALAGAGLYEHAESIARSLSNSTSQARALVCVWTAGAREHLIERARSLAREIDISGLPDYAAEALRGPERPPDPDELPYERRRRILIAIASEHNLDRAEAMPDDCPDFGHCDALLALLPRCAAARRQDQVRRLVARVDAVSADRTSADERNDLAAAGALALARCGLAQLAIARAEAVEHRVRQVDDLDSADLGELCAALAAVGEFERAEAVARTIGDWRRPWALVDIADRAVAAGDTARALALAADVTAHNPEHGAANLACVTRLIATLTDDPAEVRRRASQIGHQRIRVLSALAVEMARAGRDEEIERMMATAPNDWDFEGGFEADQVWIPLVAVAAEQGNTERALELTRRVTHRLGGFIDSFRDYRRLDLVKALCLLDTLPRSDVLTVHVESVAWAITEDEPRVEALAALAAAARRGGADERADGLVAEAERIARSLAADKQAKLMANLVLAVPPERARELIGSALQLGRWGAALAALANVAPNVLVRLADEHLATAQPASQL